MCKHIIRKSGVNDGMNEVISTKFCNKNGNKTGLMDGKALLFGSALEVLL